MGDERGHDLAGGETEERCLRGHPAPGPAVGDTGHGVDDESTVVVHGDLQAPFGPRTHEFVEHALDLLLQRGSRHGVRFTSQRVASSVRARTGGGL